jgi:hypothetical protein
MYIVAALALVVACAYVVNQNKQIRKDVNNIELFLISRDEVGQKKNTGAPRRGPQQPGVAGYDDDGDDDRGVAFDESAAMGLTAPPRGYAPMRDTPPPGSTAQQQPPRRQQQQHTQPQQRQALDDNDADLFADELSNAPLLGSV